MLDLVAILTIRVPALLVAITFHEFAHARMALFFGDDTAEREGRVTLNPIAHLDPVGSIGLVLGTFGWGKPVPVDSSRMNHPRADFFVSAAGPGTNLAIAAAAAGVLHLLPIGLLSGATAAGTWLRAFLFSLVVLNLSLFLFNLIPLFPLDGSHMLENVLPVEKAYELKRFGESYGMMILLALILAPGLTSGGLDPISWVIGPPRNLLAGLLLGGL